MNSPYSNNGSFRVTSPVGWRTDPFGSGSRVAHYGLDCVGVDTKNISPIRAGKVVRARNDPYGWGNYVAITTPDGYTDYYCHLEKYLVQVNDEVRPGDIIGIEGATGQVTGRHLHIERRQGTRKCDMDETNTDDCNVSNVIGIPNKVGFYKEEVIIMSDNTPANWSEEALTWAIDNELIYGDENGDYKLRESCTREQMIVFLYRLYNLLGDY